MTEEEKKKHQETDAMKTVSTQNKETAEEKKKR